MDMDIVSIHFIPSFYDTLQFFHFVFISLCRTLKQSIEKLEQEMKTINDKKSSLEKNIESLNSEKSSIAVDRDKLANEVRRLTRQESENDNQGTLWQKMTAASRELRRAEDEASAARIENNQLKEENKKLNNQFNKFSLNNNNSMRY